ncbi:MAG: phosphodiesterase [Candidatus Eremiobacteraeota bacterium]|nr:phosphodiesterase [Candidatus Eremiobacteraeota bacterium]
MIVAQLSDTHVVRPGTSYFDLDTSHFLKEAIDALHALERPPDCVVVTGDLVNGGRPDEYVRFREVMATLRFPYFVIPGNHDDRDAMRDALPARTYGESRDARVRYAIDDFEIRIVGLDANGPRPWPGAAFDGETLAWLERTLTSGPPRPTIVCVHQPPFRTGLHYLDVFGFRGARRLHAIVARHPEIGRVISGHIHCVRSARWGQTLACSGPSTSPQIVPLLLMDGRLVGKRDESAGFALHEWTANAGFTSTVHRRDSQGRYVETPL